MVQRKSKPKQPFHISPVSWVGGGKRKMRNNKNSNPHQDVQCQVQILKDLHLMTLTCKYIVFGLP